MLPHRLRSCKSNFYLTQSQCTDTGPTSPSAAPPSTLGPDMGQSGGCPQEALGTGLRHCGRQQTEEEVPRCRTCQGNLLFIETQVTGTSWATLQCTLPHRRALDVDWGASLNTSRQPALTFCSGCTASHRWMTIASTGTRSQADRQTGRQAER